MRQTTMGRGLAAGTRNGGEGAGFDVDALAMRVYRILFGRPEVRRGMDALGFGGMLDRFGKADGRRGLAVCGKEMAAHAAAGGMEGEARVVPAALHEIIDHTHGGRPRRPLPVLDRLEAEQEFREKQWQMKRLTGEDASAFAMECEAEECRKSAAIDLETAARLEEEARKQRAAGQASRARVGLTAAGGR